MKKIDKYKVVKDIVREFMEGEEGGFGLNKQGRPFYYSEDKSQGIDLEMYFEYLVEFTMDYFDDVPWTSS